MVLKMKGRQTEKLHRLHDAEVFSVLQILGYFPALCRRSDVPVPRNKLDLFGTYYAFEVVEVPTQFSL